MQDEWLVCQRNWLYLESIFSAPDIQRQLPTEAKMFIEVDKSWKHIMKSVYMMPKAMPAATKPGLLAVFQNNNGLLDQIMQCLEAYLESKRMVFPRFYFLSNDELLEILAQTRNPLAVQPHLRKCFDAIAKLEFAPGEAFDILGMISPEGENVPLTRGLKARGNVEDWLGKVEEAMFICLRKIAKTALEEFPQYPRKKWLLMYPSQVVLTISQVIWCLNVTDVLKTLSLKNLQDFEIHCFEELNESAGMVRGELTKLNRAVLCALITIDVHARDIITDMIQHQVQHGTVTSLDSFEWLKQLRYYWDATIDDCIVRMSNSEYIYGYEYLGASPRLVITPLTDKCYLCLMGALQLNLGGAPAGPAGTGKTETTKDLAKSLAKQCVVFNCSEGLDYKMMGKFFSGLAQSGAWCCFDEFNRIDIEVLSVIAQQLLTIRNAKAAKAKRFIFEGREIRLIPSCAAFITMNPGYAGRTELPDNLKALFRPVSMMVPDYTLIAEVVLYSEGFESSKSLAHKMTQMYKLCSEQLSQQDHYDFGMRALKSVLVMAGSLKRENPDKPEDIVILRALHDSNMPKFLAKDGILFKAILQDLFPGAVLPITDYGVFNTAIIHIIQEQGLQPEETFIKKIIQLFETMVVRHGVMLVGPAGSGKTTCYEILGGALSYLHANKVPSPYYQPVHTYVLNPKSITMGELYGEVNLLTLEWKDGLLGNIVRGAVQDESEDHHWVVCDGPVDAVWIENLNTVLDDNKMLCLANSERIKYTPYIHMVFEVQDLAQASPATVSRSVIYLHCCGATVYHCGWDRCGMVYIDAEDLSWRPVIKTWIQNLPPEVPNNVRLLLYELFDTSVDEALYFTKKNCVEVIPQVNMAKVCTLSYLMESLFLQPHYLDIRDVSTLENMVTLTFLFCYWWAFTGTLTEPTVDRFDGFLVKHFENYPRVKIFWTGRFTWQIFGESSPLMSQLPSFGAIRDYFPDFRHKKLELWTKQVPVFSYNPAMNFFDILVPTLDTVKYSFLMRTLLKINRPILYTGSTGVGKSVIAQDLLKKISKTENYIPVFMNFSAQTNSRRTQEIIEIKLDKKRKNLYGAPPGKTIIIFIDDLNMPQPEIYGAQPPIELLRQYLDFKGFYDRETLLWKQIEVGDLLSSQLLTNQDSDDKNVILSAACGPPGGGRNNVTPRLLRHFSVFSIPQPTADILKQIFLSITRGYFANFADDIFKMCDGMVKASVEIYARMLGEFLPTPTKSHYIFNLRDLSKSIQGLMQSDPETIKNGQSMFNLFLHESMRVFHDRLIDNEDRVKFVKLLSEVAGMNFSYAIDSGSLIEKPILFGDFLRFMADPADRHYEEMKDHSKVKTILVDYIEDYNFSTPKEIKLVFFMDAIQHVTRIARIIRQERGNALLVGVGGCGKQSLTKSKHLPIGCGCVNGRLASHLCMYTCFQIELTKGYGYSEFHEDLKKLYQATGSNNENKVFLFTDNQVVREEFLEDINNILNSGEVPSLFEPDEFEKVLLNVRLAAKAAGIGETRDDLYNFFVSRVRQNLHIVLAMSPVGSAFRVRCRMFPSLVNCCTIDWFNEWPYEALLSVAENSFSKLTLEDTSMIPRLSQMCMAVHAKVNKVAVRFQQELNRPYYTTPTSYLELINLYLAFLGVKHKQIAMNKKKFFNGVSKLIDTNKLVAGMEVELTALAPKLKQKSADTEQLMEQLTIDQAEADKVRDIVKKEEAIAQSTADATAAIKADAQKDLDEALPALEKAVKALNALDKNDISEVRVFNKPPEMVQVVMEAVCILLGSNNNNKGMLNHHVDRSICPVKEPPYLNQLLPSDLLISQALCQLGGSLEPGCSLGNGSLAGKLNLLGSQKDADRLHYHLDHLGRLVKDSDLRDVILVQGIESFHSLLQGR
ncbi:DNAH6 [Cordylochernes scorpioides]|uniref:DNAH6 n=1 Tax=Cordylochernes scorpioides TaxID=51811 RepID=A0ABY6LJG9_9ARAC|nr:DNAH6 [Cordylochernes scorpioides]